MTQFSKEMYFDPTDWNPGLADFTNEDIENILTEAGFTFKKKPNFSIDIFAELNKFIGPLPTKVHVEQSEMRYQDTSFNLVSADTGKVNKIIKNIKTNDKGNTIGTFKESNTSSSNVSKRKITRAILNGEQAA
ncbi:hypothetical protein OSJ94_11500 [Levilactobacillus brevis]|uniref:hypothetical protein n=1 Tax=Levilactobacillus brevis TaxID=1580 RepID=UPI00225DF03C|nr:hypothetical protein [Levilactobacillus brevis]MCX7511804.1 hypothetical protein [Levilactobacillus brevis]